MNKIKLTAINILTRSNWFYISVVFLITLIVAGYFSLIGVDPHHDGIMLKPALDLIEGKNLFSQSFTQYGALTTLLQASALSLFGKYLIVIRIQTAFFYALSAVFMWLLWQKIMPKSLAFATIIIWILLAPYYELQFLPWSSVYSLCFQVVSIYLITLYLDRNKTKHLFYSGITSSCTFLTRQPVGILLFISILLFVITYNLAKKHTSLLLKSLKSYILGFITPILVILAWLIHNQSVKDWWLQSFVFSYKWGQIVSQNFRLLALIKKILPVSNNPISLWSIIPLVSLTLVAKLLLQLLQDFYTLIW